jgi:RNA-splicing ligase RtcB
MGLVEDRTRDTHLVDSERIRVFDSSRIPADPGALGVLHDGLRTVDLAAPAAVLPDFHLKGDKEMPSSVAVATRSTIRPVFSSTSLCCGMALVALDLDRPGDAAVADFYRGVRARFPFPPTYRRDLTTEEVVRCAAEGAAFAAERFQIEQADVDRVELGGRLDVDRLGGIDRVRRELPWSVRQLSRLRFGTIGPSNHFLELQEVVEVFEPDIASRLGLSRGQVTLQYHGGGGALPGELGLLFGRRKRLPARPARVQMAVQKPLYHYATARSIADVQLRRSLYFTPDPPPVERDSLEGERVTLANAMAMNYGFAFRLSIYAGLGPLLRAAFGSSGARLVVDTTHNSIYEEELDGRPAIVHRHNACRVFPASTMAHHPVFGRTGQPLLVPGTSRTSSYVCVPGEHPERAVNTACHGAGTVVSRFARAGRSVLDPHARRTLRFGYEREHPDAVPQFDDRGVDAAVEVLRDHGIARPVARLRPFAVLN